jgi:hypothetical protein
MERKTSIFKKKNTRRNFRSKSSKFLSDLPDPQKDEERVKDGKDEWLVMLEFALI